jgi:hypothetical protein
MLSLLLPLNSLLFEGVCDNNENRLFIDGYGEKNILTDLGTVIAEETLELSLTTRESDSSLDRLTETLFLARHHIRAVIFLLF